MSICKPGALFGVRVSAFELRVLVEAAWVSGSWSGSHGLAWVQYYFGGSVL